MSLQNVLEEIKKVKPLAETEVEVEPVATLNGRRGRQAAAKESLKRLKRDYKGEMLRSAMFIVSVGSGREDLAKLATEDFGLFVTDPETFYNDLAKRVPQALYLNKAGVSNIFDVLGRHLEDKMNELDINEYNQLLFKAEYAEEIKSQEQFAGLIKRAINAQIGSEIVGIQAVESLVDEAVTRGHKDNVTPIVLTTGDTKLALSLLKDLERITSRVFLLGTGEVEESLKNVDGAILLEDTSKKNVKDALKLMRKSLRK